MRDQEPVQGSPPPQIPARTQAVGTGWHPVLGRLHEQLTVLCPGYRLVDLKEKFGGLRILLDVPEDSDSSAVRPLIQAAERDAAVTCEFCGAPGRARTRGDAPTGWVKTVCDSCHTAWSAHRLVIINGVLHRRPAKAAPP
jgi:hypothetical protein